MNPYVQGLVNLICKNDTNQVDKFITKVMRPQSVDYDERRGQLGALQPTYKKQSADDGKTSLVGDGHNVEINNNPEYPPNMIDRLNTPFDYIERILFQDFSSAFGIGTKDPATHKEKNYFTELIRLTRTTKPQFNYGVEKIQIKDDTNVSYQNREWDGEFFIDSFTYTPFIDYSMYDGQAAGNEFIDDGTESQDVGDVRIGVYQDDFLTEYNTGVYDSKDNATQVDEYRGKMTSTLFKLGNLEKDVYDAKIAFRNAIFNESKEKGLVQQTDAKVYIETFCQHLATLFAKLSNIRMSHEIYGFKPPHQKWEGILALDIWYQMLYRNIDANYPFDPTYYNANPMSRYQVKVDEAGRQYIECEGQIVRVDVANQSLPSGFEWAEVDRAGKPVQDKYGYVLVWKNDIWSEYKSNSKKIADDRSDCVTPRGVLCKIYQLVNDATATINDEIHMPTDRDFDWFYQRGNVYSDHTKSPFTKYPNLHLGLAYETMSAKDYQEKILHRNQDYGTFNKDLFSLEIDEQITLKARMIECGYEALYDAFCVIKNEHVFNIYNSSTNAIELFSPDNANSYSQAQCAIVIERVFSRLYKYLQFKSTTGEVFQRHINIDSGYKYLTSESILNSDNPNGREIYYNDNGDDKVSYLRYLDKLNDYKNWNELTVSEKAVLGHFITIISRKEMEQVRQSWDLCPLCRYEGEGYELEYSTPRDVAEGEEEEEEEPEVTFKIVVDYEKTDKSWMNWHGVPTISETRTAKASQFAFNLADISGRIEANSPTYTSTDGSGETIIYQLLGYSDARGSSNVVYGKNYQISKANFNLSSTSPTLTLYPVWTSQVIMEFSPGSAGTAQTTPVSPMVVPQNTAVRIPKCTYVYNHGRKKKVEYYNNEKWKDVERFNSPEEVNKYAFLNWEYSGGSSGSEFQGIIEDEKSIVVQLDTNWNIPIIKITAKWEQKYDEVLFKVDSEPYCTVMVPDRRVKYPSHNPEPTDGSHFIGWSVMEGYVLPDVDFQMQIICDSDLDGEIVCSNNASLLGDGTNIVCGEINEHDDFHVDAFIAQDNPRMMTVTFKYFVNSGEDNKTVQPVQVQQDVGVETRVPNFHIHNYFEMEGEDNYKYEFRYWRLDSGNINPQMMVLSDCVFSAVYDKVLMPAPDVDELEPPEIILPIEEDNRANAHSMGVCPYLSKVKGIPWEGKPERRYCTYSGIDPRRVKSPGYPFDKGIGCPYIKLLRQINGIVGNQNFVDKENDFEIMTLLQIDDISNLIKALFKINIDIAHKEYYLKVDIPPKTDWWYGFVEGGDFIICGPQERPIICEGNGQEIVCERNYNETGDLERGNWISFEPSVELKFSNFHALNQVENGKILCTVDEINSSEIPGLWITPINRELLSDAKDKGGAIHYNEVWYYYDYKSTLMGVFKANIDAAANKLESVVDYEDIGDKTRYYNINPLCMYKNTTIQSPVDVNGFVRHKMNVIGRDRITQLKTFTSIVKKYRPIIMPDVRYIFNDCVNNKTKYEVDRDNDYGIFGWCTIPSKTMVNMEYNEESIIVPSSYDHYNRIGGRNFLQMDKDFDNIYKQWDPVLKKPVSMINDSWYYLYDTRDWTYFLKPFFGVKPNNDVYTWQFETFATGKPTTSDHLNGVIFEPTTTGREKDANFGDLAATCKFLAKYHHNERNLRILSDEYTRLIPFEKLVSLTTNAPDQFNSKYGSQYPGLPEDFVFPYEDWVDEFNKTGSYTIKNDNGEFKYAYNLGQSHAIDDFDDNSVWFYITMTRPVDDIPQVIEIEDLMPFVFWWQNRGEKNNGPTANCYGIESSAKLNYVKGGWCYSGSQEKMQSVWEIGRNGVYEQVTKCPYDEQHWHAVQHTMGIDFSKNQNGGVIVTTDNSGNAYKGPFDPNCAGTDEKWKVHNTSNAFGVNQTDDPKEDKYYKGSDTHGEGNFVGKEVPDSMNADVLQSIKDRPMAWNLWNVVRHYVFIRYFKNKNKELGDNLANWDELERLTRKFVKGIYRSFKEKQNTATNARNTFNGVDGTNNYQGQRCLVNWTNSFIEVQSILERNAREHEASFVLFTGDVRPNQAPSVPGLTVQQRINKYLYEAIQSSPLNFRVATLHGVDSSKDGIRPDSGQVWSYSGKRPKDLPPKYVIGDNQVYSQRKNDIEITFSPYVDLDAEYPEAEYYKNNQLRKWIRRMTHTVMNQQIIPIYTSMENMTTGYHYLTDEQMKSITFQVVPQFYWRYEWTFNEFMIHPVGKLNPTSPDSNMYDMLGNVWEWVRDDWTANVSALNGKTNPIVGTQGASFSQTTKKVIKGGAFDQYCRKTISASREGLEYNENQSQYGTQANVGFRPSLVYTFDKKPKDPSGGDGEFPNGTTPVDLFFLFDASSSAEEEIQAMIDSAKAIVARFSPKIAGTSPSADEMNICHVGSALFLGPNIRLMCSEMFPDGKMIVPLLAKKPYWKQFCDEALTKDEQDRTVAAYDAALLDVQNAGGVVECGHWNGGYGLQPADNRRWDIKLGDKYLAKINDIRARYHQETAAIASTRGVGEDPAPSFNGSNGVADAPTFDDIELVDPVSFSSDEDENEPTGMIARNDVGTGGIGGGGGEAGHVAKFPCYTFDVNPYHCYIHHGVPTWKDAQEVVHFGAQNQEVPFHTYNPWASDDPTSTFESPFITITDPLRPGYGKGVLTNFYSGSESISKVLSTLLGDGMFCGFPHLPGIGYVFRNPEIPKFIFVYTNEFDNEVIRTKDKQNQKDVVTLRAKNARTVTVAPVKVGDEIKLVPCTQGDTNRNPPDPFCYQQLYGIGDAEVFMECIKKKIGLQKEDGDEQAPVSTIREQINYIINQGFSAALRDQPWCCAGYWLASENHNPLGNSRVIYTPDKNDNLQYKSSVSIFPGKVPPSKVLTAAQLQYYSNWGTFQNVISTGTKPWWFIDYSNAQTLGFYELNYAISKIETPVFTYLFTTDANAPKMVDLGDADGTKIPIMFGENYDFFEKILKVSNGATAVTYEQLYTDCVKYYASGGGWNKKPEDSKYAVKFERVFGFKNPYMSVNIVFGRRGSTGVGLFKKKSGSKPCYVVGLPMEYRKFTTSNVKTILQNAISTNGSTDIEGYTIKINTSDMSGTVTRTSDNKVATCIWSVQDWLDNKSDCRLNLNELNANLADVSFDSAKSKWGVERLLSLDTLIPSNGVRQDRHWAHSETMGDHYNPYAFSTDFAIDDVVTVWYRKSASDPVLGVLRIVSFTCVSDLSNVTRKENWTYNNYHTFRQSSSQNGRGHSVYQPFGTENFTSGDFKYGGEDEPTELELDDPAQGSDTSKTDSVLKLLANPIGYEYPDLWKKMVCDYAYDAALNKLKHKEHDFGSSIKKNISSNSWETYAPSVAELFNNLPASIAALMAYRFQTQIFDNLRSGFDGGKCVTDYEDNAVTFKAMPVMNFTELGQWFFDSGVFEGGQIMDIIESVAQFSYPQCVIDLNPTTYADYVVQKSDEEETLVSPTRGFPLKFTALKDPQGENGVYKKSKILMNRVEFISGTNFDTFTMGSRPTDYDEVTDPYDLLWRDPESIETKARNDQANVTLGTGGSFQKKKADVDESQYTPDWEHPDNNPEELKNNFYWLMWADKPRKRKYKKNKFFFIDPFELTIAQWCHAHGWHTKGDARNRLNAATDKANFAEMRRSYWKYLYRYEPIEWNNLISGKIDQSNDVEDMLDRLELKDNQSQIYNPLEDTRPYYYATYENVRGTPQVYAAATGSSASTYLIDSTKGDEFQMNTRTGTTSFMDILNNNVVYGDYKREKFIAMPDGGEIIADTQQGANLDNCADIDFRAGWSATREWASGKTVGLNFDLPTEAQWEYCCRAGDTFAFPKEHNLGKNMERQDENLDKIAWYKYRDIGKLPEPEKFCTWRISKMLFGVSKDPEQVNNVYETTD